MGFPSEGATIPLQSKPAADAAPYWEGAPIIDAAVRAAAGGVVSSLANASDAPLLGDLLEGEGRLEGDVPDLLGRVISLGVAELVLVY